MNRGRGAELGFLGETLAEGFLRKRGYRIIEKNFRCRLGEIDLIARERKSLVFIEVKLRKSLRYGLPEAAIDFFKKRKIIRAALWYMMSRNLADAPARFDVVTVRIDNEDRTARVRLIRDAFSQ